MEELPVLGRDASPSARRLDAGAGHRSAPNLQPLGYHRRNVGALADRPFALAYAHIAARNPAAQDRSGPTAASLGVAAAASLDASAENSGKGSVVLRAESRDGDREPTAGCRGFKHHRPGQQDTAGFDPDDPGVAPPEVRLPEVPSLLVSPMALTVSRRVDEAIWVATACRPHTAEKQAAEALQNAGPKVVAAILLTTPRSSGANGTTPGKTKTR